MKLLTACLLAAAIALPATAQTTPTREEALAIPDTRTPSDGALLDANWALFSTQLRVALDADHDGLAEGALRAVIAYGDKLTIDQESIFQIARIFRDHSDQRLRQMAAVALGLSGSDWGIDYLERSVDYERNEKVKNTIVAVLASV